MTSHPRDVVRNTDTPLGPIDLTPAHATTRPVDVWNARHFSGRLSPVALELLRGLDSGGHVATLPDHDVASIDALEARP